VPQCPIAGDATGLTTVGEARRIYSVSCHLGTKVVFLKLCRTAGSSRVQRTESVTVMGHPRSAAVSFTGSVK